MNTIVLILGRLIQIINVVAFALVYSEGNYEKAAVHVLVVIMIQLMLMEGPK